MNLIARIALASFAVFVALAGSCLGKPISPRRLLEVVDLEWPVTSPNGHKVAFRAVQASVERNTYDSVWYVQDMDNGSPPVRVAEGGVPLRDSAGGVLPAVAVWSPDGLYIYFRAFFDGSVAVWRARADGSGARSITRDAADVRAFSLSPDGRILTYGVGATREDVAAAERAEYYQGIHVDKALPLGQNLFRSGYIKGRLATQRLGFWFDRVPLLANTPDQWRAVDLASGKMRELTASGVSQARQTDAPIVPKSVRKPWKLAIDPDGQRVALLHRVGESTGLVQKPDVELWVVDRNKGRPIKCQDASCTKREITGVQWRPGSDEVLFTVTDPSEGLAQSIFRWSVGTGVVQPVTYSRGLINGGRDQFSQCGVSHQALLCVAAEADRPPHLERIDLETGSHRLLYDPNESLARDMTKDIRVRMLRWTDAKGQQFTGQYFPAKETPGSPSPLFVTYYKCSGFLRGGVGDEWPLASLASNGISALCINAAPYLKDAVVRYDSGTSAVRSVIDRLASAGEVDRSKVGMGGLSFGTEVTLWTVIHSHLLSAASVSSLAISQQYYLLGSLKGDDFKTGLRDLWQLGPPGDTVKQWQRISPALNLDKIQIPILMQLPEQEFTQSLDYAVPLVGKLGADVYVFPNEPHQKFQPRHKMAVYERNMDWFRFWLLGVEDGNPAKVQQYKHWREMEGRLSARHADPSGDARAAHALSTAKG
jgi:dipeptidyl aminopeptidase/acylaminoacyl peptidase